MVRFRLKGLIAGAALSAAVPLLVVMACGPDFEPEVFVPASHPHNPNQFAAGQLGVLQPGYARADLVVAYRYLHGGRMSKEEQLAYAGPTTPQSGTYEQEQAALPVNRWQAARAVYVKSGAVSSNVALIVQDRTLEKPQTGYVERIDLLNCTDGAFATAQQTLESRAKQWGAASGELREWLNGQDEVFSNCAKPGETPQPVPAQASALLRQDRAYQIAAANFYAGNYDAAIAGFEAVGADKASPWSRFGEYLAARAEVRKAAISAPLVDWGEQAKFDPEWMKKAQTRLRRVHDTSQDEAMKHAALAELAFIQVRQEPVKRLNDVAAALAGPKPDAEFGQHLADLLFLTGKDVKGDADLLHWIAKVKDTEPMMAWRNGGELPWMVAALSSAKGKDVDAALMSAAAKVPADSPGYLTVNYHRVRLLLESGKKDEARKLAGSLLASLNGDDTAVSRNAVLELRMATSRSFAEFLADAPRTVIESNSQAAGLAKCYDQGNGKGLGPAGCVKDLPALQFDLDAARALNQEIPLSLWVEAAHGAALTPELRQALAMAGWVRAIGLNDAATAKDLAAMLPEPIRKTAVESIDFPATLTMLRNPGLRPYVQQGTQRSLSYHVLDSYRDNWWCSKWGDGEPWQSDGTAAPTGASMMPHADFLTSQQRAAAQSERDKLNALTGGVAWLGQRAIEYVKLHPSDKDGAEVLGLTVRATRYGCSDGQGDSQKVVSKEAFQMLHRMYPKSVWAARTPYSY